MSADSTDRTPDAGVVATDEPSAVDDPRVSAALDRYLAELQAGRRPSRREFLGRHPEIAEALERGLDVLEFLHSAAGDEGPRPQGPAGIDALPPETILGDYRLIREVGRGGMGVVYEARQISLGRRVAVKVLSGAGVLDPRRLERFRIEAQAVAQLSHPHIVPIIAIGCDRGVHYYAMQYIEGGTLADVLEKHPGRRGGLETSTIDCGSRASDRPGGASDRPEGPAMRPTDPGPGRARSAPPPEAAPAAPIASKETSRAIAELGIQAAEALDHAHAMGVLHRDIKPSNLLIDTRGSLWIADFGLARFRDDSGLTLTGDLVGTLRYMAPEMAQGRRTSFDPRSDIYALGATLYELATLRPVFAGQDRRELLRRILEDEPVAPRRIDPTIPRDLETIVMKAMAKEPEARYATASELVEDLRRFLEDKPIHARPPTPWEKVAKSARRHRAALIPVVSVLLIALGIVSELLWQVWQERQNTAKFRSDKLLVLNQGLGALNVNVVNLADELTMKGMGQFASTARTPEEKQGLQAFYDRAIAFYESVLREPAIDPRSQALAFRRLGFTRMVSTNDARAREDYLRALAIYEELLRDDPKAADLLDGLADVHYNLGIWLLPPQRGGIRAAEPEFRASIRIAEQRAVESPMEPGRLDAVADQRLQLASWMERGGMKAEAERERGGLFDFYQRVTSVVWSAHPGDNRNIMARWAAGAYWSLAQGLGQPDRGWARDQERALRLGLAFEPDRPELLYDLAGLLAFRSDPGRDAIDEAVKLANRAAEKQSKRPEYWRVLALAYLHANDLKSASEALENSLKPNPEEKDRASHRVLMAMVSWQEGRQDQAKTWYIRAIDRMARNPDDDPDAHKYLSEARCMLKPVLGAEYLAGDTRP